MRRIAIVIILLAGCAGPETTDVLAEEPCIVESADDQTCMELDANKPPDQVAHVHDYWAGATSLRLLEESRSITGGHYGSCGPYPIMSILPPDDATVLQGTGRLDIQARFDESADHRAGILELWVRTADQDAPSYIADIDGTTIEMLVNASAADLPHQALSAWEFWLYANPDPELRPASCRIMPRGTLHLEVDIAKTLTIAPFPGHPDHWGNATELTLLDAHADVARYARSPGYCDGGDGASHPGGSCQMWWRGFGPLDGLIVPPGARTISLRLTLDPDPTHDGAELGLRYHGADTRELERAPPRVEGDNFLEFEIDVNDRHDGPYARQSQWQFQVVTESTDGTYAGGWLLEATVKR